MDQNPSDVLDDKDTFTKESHQAFFLFEENALRSRKRQEEAGFQTELEEITNEQIARDGRRLWVLRTWK